MSTPASTRAPRPSTAPTRPSRGHRRHVLGALAGLALCGAVAATTAWPGDGEPGTAVGADAVILPGGERLACRVVEEREGMVTIELHGRTFRLERARLEGVERDGQPAVDPVLQEAVSLWARQAASDHAALRRGALAALQTLGPADLPALRAALATLEAGPAGVLDEIAATLEARSLRGQEDASVNAALEAIGLTADRAPLVARVARAYVFRVARGGNPEGAVQELRARLAPLLDMDDLETVVRVLGQATGR
ncbi:MAG: hypothetical protein AB7T63_13375 [Planctomycetota bacterium]